MGDIVKIALIGTAILGQALASVSGSSAGSLLVGDQIRKDIAGRTLSDVNEFQQHFSTTYSTDGTMAGVSSASVPSQDHGQWWVQGNQLCQKWTVWRNGATRCFSVEKVGGGIKLTFAG
jgi:hypothetical protein